jgi:DNA polymerase-3 subunit delta'
LFDWYAILGVQNKQGEIRVDDARNSKITISEIIRSGYKIMIIWMADKLNIAASNKLLKLLEEPPKDGFILISENEEDSNNSFRCQILHFNGLSEPIIRSIGSNREDQSKHSGKNRTSSTGKLRCLEFAPCQ